MSVFLFTDIENSTRLWEEHKTAMRSVLAKHDNILQDVVGKHGGHIIRHRGDGMSIVFEEGTPLKCAIEIQQRFAAEQWHPIETLRVRVGLHAGEAERREFTFETMGQKEEYFGRVLNRTARIMDTASGGQIVLTPETLEETTSPEGAKLENLGLHLLKNLDKPQKIYGLLHPDLPFKTFPPLRSLARADSKIPDTPYKGLFAFQERDAPFFFGREIFTERLLQVVDRQAMTAVIGPSGSGKSSVVYAGLVPHLRPDPGILIADFRPGSQPLHTLSAVLVPLIEPELSQDELILKVMDMVELLKKDITTINPIIKELLEEQNARRLVLIANQFEELYTLCPDVNIRQMFLDILFEAVTASEVGTDIPMNFHLIATLRADFMGQALTHRPFADSLQISSVILGPMNRDELERAIRNPAEKQGIIFEGGLVERILDDVGHEPGNLPLLQFALTLMWERQENMKLTHSIYEAIGHVEGALTHHANIIYDELTEMEKELAHKIFIQLVTPGEGTEDTRRLTTRLELGEEKWILVQQLADARLVVTDSDPNGQEVVEVVHEALIRNWDILHRWLIQDRIFRTWQERLRTALAQWHASGRDKGALLRGALLAEADELGQQRNDEFSQHENEFIQTSIEARDTTLIAIEAQRQRELKQAQALAESEFQRAEEHARASKRLQWLAVGLAFVMIIVLGMAAWACFERQNAQTESNARATEVVVRTTTAEHDAVFAQYQAETEVKIALSQKSDNYSPPLLVSYPNHQPLPLRGEGSRRMLYSPLHVGEGLGVVVNGYKISLAVRRSVAKKPCVI